MGVSTIEDDDMIAIQRIEVDDGVEAVEGVEVEDGEEELNDLLLAEVVAQGLEEGVAGLFRRGVGNLEELENELIALREESPWRRTQQRDLFFRESLTLSLSVADVGSVLAVSELRRAEADELAGIGVPLAEGFATKEDEGVVEAGAGLLADLLDIFA